MADLSDLEIDFDDSPNDENVNPEEDVPRSFKDAFLGFTQRTQQYSNRWIATTTNNAEEIEPENDFERQLMEFKCFLKRDEDGKTQIWLEEITFSELVHGLNQRLVNKPMRDSLVNNFILAVENRSKFQLYLSPCNSPKGLQDTIFRALLSCIHTQVKVFDVFMDKLDALAKSEGEESKKLAVACVAQIRFLERIVDSSAMFEAIFDRKLEHWSPSARDYLIEALPEVLTDVACQQDAALTLRDMILRRPAKEIQTYQAAIVRTLNLLRMSGEVAKKIRQDLCRSIMDFEAPILPDLVTFFLQTLTFDNKSSLRHVLEELSSHLKTASLRVDRASKRVTVDEILLEMFSKLCRFVQLEGSKGWKEMLSFFRKSVQAPVEDQVDETINLEIAEKSRIFDYFDVLFCFSLMSLDSCPPGITTIFHGQAANHQENLKDSVNFILRFKKLSAHYLKSLTQLAQQCLWKNNEEVQEIGAIIYRNLFITVPGSRQHILQLMLGHLSSSSNEATAILSTLEKLVKDNYEEFSPFAKEIKDCLDHLDILSLNNIKRLFSVLVLTYTSSDDQEAIKSTVSKCITKFLSSLNEKEQIWGILGLLMQLKDVLERNNDSNRETKVTNLLKFLNTQCSSTRVRSVMYTELAIILQENIRSLKSQAVLTWVDDLFVSFRNDFFVQQKEYQAINDLEEPRFVNEECTLWLKTSSPQLVELLPLFQLLRGAALLRQKWAHDDDTQVAFNQHFNQLFFAFEANIALNTVDITPTTAKAELLKSADILYLVIEWIRELLNTFMNCSIVNGIEPEEMKKIWSRKFNLMCVCQEKLETAIELVHEWPLPIISSYYDKVLVVAKEPPRKRPQKPRSTGKKKRTEEEECSEDPDEQVKKDSIHRSGKIVIMERYETVQLAALNTRFRQIHLGTIVRCLHYMSGKVRATLYLVTEFISICKVILPKRSRLWSSRGHTALSSNTKIHGDSIQTWKYIVKGCCELWCALNKIVEQFRTEMSGSQINDQPSEVQARLILLMKECLTVFHLVLQSPEMSLNTNVTAEEHRRITSKRRNLMEKLEKTMLLLKAKGSQNNSPVEEPERAFVEYLLSISDVVPNLDVAVALVQAISNCQSWTDELYDRMARLCLQFLKKEWLNVDGNPHNGPSIYTPCKIILENYILFRPKEYQINCILWFLANKVTELVPEDEKRRSKISSYEEVDDPGLTPEDKRDHFGLITRKSLPPIYKVLFHQLCNIVQKRVAPREIIIAKTITVKQLIKEWKVAASAFCILCLLLRVKELRSLQLMLDAVKEGRRFLSLFAKNSSFMSVMEEHSLFASVANEAIAVIKTIQIGNRTLQNIGVYAKTHRSVKLLRGMPELRAASELWMRSVHTVMVTLGCEEAFEIGLLKSRDINGEEIRMEEEEDTSSEPEEKSQKTEDDNESDDDNGSDNDESRHSPVY